MLCPRCGKKMDWSVQVTMHIPDSMLGYLSKKNIRKKNVEIIAVNWPSAKNICRNMNCAQEFKNKEEKKKIKQLLKEVYDYINFFSDGISLNLKHKVERYMYELKRNEK